MCLKDSWNCGKLALLTEAFHSIKLVTVVAGYASQGRLLLSTKRWIDALRDVSTYLILVFDQDTIDGLAEYFLDDPCISVYVERHGAYDFGSYKRGLSIAEERQWIQNSSHVLLCNDSVIGPFVDLNTVLEGMTREPSAVWGLSDSSLYRPHLQSYFLLMQRSLIEIDEVREFFDAVVPQPSRQDVIQTYEIGFSTLISQLGMKWRSLLSIESMFDPQNGERMTNSTAYPICSLSAGSPILKNRALKELSANADGLWSTCQALAEQHPKLWKEIWSETPHRRLWQEAIPLGVLLTTEDLPILGERLEWLEAHPHPSLCAIIALASSQIEIRADIYRQFKSYLKYGLLKIMVVNSVSNSEQTLIRLLSTIGTDWVVASSSSLWRDFAGLQLQLRRLIANPAQHEILGSPILLRTDQCFCIEKIHFLLNELGVAWEPDCGI